MSKINRKIKVISISFKNEPGEILSYFDNKSNKNIDEEVTELFNKLHGNDLDIIIFPETLVGKQEPIDLNNPIITLFSRKAIEYCTYIVCPVFRKDDQGNRRNSIILIDRNGEICGTYDKMFPFITEFDLIPPVVPGNGAVVIETDFGKVGFAICFDVNFPELWSELSDNNAEIVICCSAYSMGTSLQAHAKNHHYYIITSTMACDCTVYDINGELMYYSKGRDYNISDLELDLDRGIYHENFNIEKINKMLDVYKDRISIENHMEKEEWIILKAIESGISVRELARKFGILELREYKKWSRENINKFK